MWLFTTHQWLHQSLDILYKRGSSASQSKPHWGLQHKKMNSNPIYNCSSFFSLPVKHDTTWLPEQSEVRFYEIDSTFYRLKEQFSVSLFKSKGRDIFESVIFPWKAIKMCVRLAVCLFLCLTSTWKSLTVFFPFWSIKLECAGLFPQVCFCFFFFLLWNQAI